MKRFFIWSGLSLLGLLAIVLFIGAVLTYRAGVRLDEKIAALRAAGQPVSLADLAPSPIPPEGNAHAYTIRARSESAAIETVVDAANEATSQEDQAAFDDARPTPAMLQVMRAALAAHPSVVPLVEEASRCPGFDPLLNYHTDVSSFNVESGEQSSAYRSIFRVAGYQVLVQIDDGHREEALQTCLAMFRLTRLLERNPLELDELVCIACRGLTIKRASVVLQSGPLPEPAYASLEQELALHDPIERFRQMVRNERAFGLDAFREMTADMTSAFNAPQWLKVVWPWIRGMSPWLKNDECDFIDATQRCIEGAALPYRQWSSEIEVKSSPVQSAMLTELLLYGLQGVHGATFRSMAELRTLRVLNALMRREQTGVAGEPTLADLGLPVDVTTDPFNDEPLHIKKLPGGWLVYSVGPDLKDDGGNLAQFLDVGLGPPPAPKPADPDESLPADAAE